VTLTRILDQTADNQRSRILPVTGIWPNVAVVREFAVLYSERKRTFAKNEQLGYQATLSASKGEGLAVADTYKSSYLYGYDDAEYRPISASDLFCMGGR